LKENNSFPETLHWDRTVRSTFYILSFLYERRNRESFAVVELLPEKQGSKVWMELKKKFPRLCKGMKQPRKDGIYRAVSILDKEGFTEDDVGNVFRSPKRQRSYGKRLTDKGLLYARSLGLARDEDTTQTMRGVPGNQTTTDRTTKSAKKPSKDLEKELTFVERVLGHNNIAPWPSVKNILSGQGRDTWAIDAGVVIFYTPNFEGFGPDRIRSKYDRRLRPLPSELEHIVDLFGKLASHEQDLPKFFIADFWPTSVDQKQGDRWEIILGRTSYKINRAIEAAVRSAFTLHSRKTTLWKEFETRRYNFFKPPFWSMAVVHLAVVCQEDNQILFGLRGFKSSYYNNTWAVTIDEESDPSEDKDFFDTGVRALHEELGIENAKRNWITLNAIARECDYMNSNINMGILGVARVPYTADEVIRNKWPRATDKDELIGLDARPFTKDSFNDLGVVIASDAYKPISPFCKISKFHPISRLALLLATFQEFGRDFVVDDLRKMSLAQQKK